MVSKFESTVGSQTITAIPGDLIKVQVSDNARVVLERRYLAKDEHGNPVETPEQMFWRVASNIAQAEVLYKPLEDFDAATHWANRFYEVMARLEYIPNSPTLMNAGRELQQLSACFVLPVEDSIEGIFESLKYTALIHKSGGGTGFSFSRLRPEGDRVKSTAGVASGPVSFLKIFDCATEQIKQGGTRRGANMGILAVDHPDIEKFIVMKADMVTATNFNISVAVTDRFMQAVARDEETELVSPRNGQVVGKRRARALFDMMVENAWRNGDPGLIFIDRINDSESNPTPKYGRIEATNPCGEEPLFPYESCNLGSINLTRFVKPAGTPDAQANGKPGNSRVPATSYDSLIDWDRLAEVVAVCVRFLDNVIDMNRYPLAQIEEMTRKMRRIGLGVMGWADMLFQLRVPYNSEEALALADRVMGFIQQKADEASIALAEERGVFAAWEDSIYNPANGHPKAYLPDGRVARYRNCNRTVIAPTGTISIIADCSGGIEPLFALAFTRQHYLDPKDPSKLTQLTEVNRYFLAVAQQEGFYSEELMQYLAEGGKLADRPEVPDWVKRVFVTAHDITPEWHIRMQAAFQKHTNNAVSKTINFPYEATIEDVRNAYWLAYELGCKGITIYREGSRDWSVLSHAKPKAEAAATESVAATSRSPELPEVSQPAAQASVAAPAARPVPYRERLPDERQSITHKFQVGEQEGYLTVGLFEDGRPGEIFVKISKEGSTVSGLMDSVALLTSVALQYGVPLEDLARKFKNSRFEPYGRTNNPQIPMATSLVDYIFRYLELKFVPEERRSGNGYHIYPYQQTGAQASGQASATASPPARVHPGDESGLGCPDCGAVLIYQEGCLFCRSCGYNKCG